MKDINWLPLLLGLLFVPGWLAQTATLTSSSFYDDATLIARYNRLEPAKQQQFIKDYPVLENHYTILSILSAVIFVTCLFWLVAIIGIRYFKNQGRSHTLGAKILSKVSTVLVLVYVISVSLHSQLFSLGRLERELYFLFGLLFGLPHIVSLFYFDSRIKKTRLQRIKKLLTKLEK